MEEKVIPGKHVSMVYDLYVVEPDGTEALAHQSDPEDPEQIIFGVTRGVIVPLEQALDGLKAGDEFDVKANAEEAFGPHVEEQVVTLPKDMFEVDGKFDSEVVAVGKYVPMPTADGFRLSGLVTKIDGDEVTLDFNHPLAGKDVRFKGRVLTVRDATDDELHLETQGSCSCSGGCAEGEGDEKGCCGDCHCN